MTFKSFFYHKGAQAGVLAVLVAGGMLLWWLAIGEEQAILGNSAAKLETEQLVLARMQAQLHGIQNVVDRHQHNLSEIKYFRENFLKNRKARIVAISDFLNQQAVEHRLRLEEVRYQSSHTRDGQLEVQNIDLPLSGKYRDIRAYINAIETSKMYLVITKLALEDDSGFEGAIRLQLSLATYFEGS